MKHLGSAERNAVAFGCNIAHTVQLNLIKPEMIKEFANNDVGNYIRDPNYTHTLSLVEGKGLMMVEGDEWKRTRKLLTSVMHNEFLKTAIPSMVNTIDNMWEDLKRNRKDLNAIDIMHESDHMTAEIFGTLYFGDRYKGIKFEGRTITELLVRFRREALTMAFLTPLYMIFGKKFIEWSPLKRHRQYRHDAKGVREVILSLTNEIIAEFERGSDYGKNTIIRALYEQRASGIEGAFTNEEIRDQFLSLIVTGNISTSHLLGEAAYYLKACCSQEFKNNLRREIETYLKDPYRVTFDDLGKMDHMTALLKETLRYSPATPFSLGKLAIRDHKLGNLNVKKGTMVCCMSISNHFDEKNFEEPFTFKPERWLSGPSVANVAREPVIYTPFWTGQRACPAQHIAMTQAKLCVGLFLKKFDYELTDPNYKMEYMQRSFCYEPKEPIRYRLTPREGIIG